MSLRSHPCFMPTSLVLKTIMLATSFGEPQQRCVFCCWCDALKITSAPPLATSHGVHHHSALSCNAKPSPTACHFSTTTSHLTWRAATALHMPSAITLPSSPGVPQQCCWRCCPGCLEGRRRRKGTAGGHCVYCCCCFDSLPRGGAQNASRSLRKLWRLRGGEGGRTVGAGD